MEIKITRKKKIGESGGAWSDYINYWLIHGRIISEDGKFYKPWKFVAEVNFSADGWDSENQRDIPEAEMLENTIASYLDAIRSFDDCQEFYDLCNETIKKWNKCAIWCHI